jgi:hypothetical protein
MKLIIVILNNMKSNILNHFVLKTTDFFLIVSSKLKLSVYDIFILNLPLTHARQASVS